MDIDMEMGPMMRELQRMLTLPDDMVKMLQPPQRTYVKNTRALFGTTADIYEHPDHYSFIMDMPGLDSDKIKVKVDEGVLHVTGKRPKKKKAEGEEEEGKPIRIERRKTRYMRKFQLPEDSNEDDVRAFYKDGVLKVTVGRKPQEKEPPKPKVVSVPVS